MKSRFASLVLWTLCWSAGWAADVPQIPQGGNFLTLVTTPLAIEGLTGDHVGNLYTTGRSPGAGLPCPVWRISLASPILVVVGFVPPPSATGQCGPSGLAFGANGNLFFSESDKIYTVKPDAGSPLTATIYASGVPGTNGLAFDRDGNLWTGDGTTGLGRVWRISPVGVVTEAFRIQPMVNAAGVGRSALTMPGSNPQALVANGVAFDPEGDMFVADTARGAIWRIAFDRQGNLDSRTGCDTTFTPNTLCLDNVFIADPLLEGADGIALDRAGNIWVDANERNAVVVVTHDGRIVEVFRNSPGTGGLRNSGPLEFPTSPFLSGDLLCTANSDGNRRDNFPNTAGEIGGAGQPKGKISCMEQRLHIPGLPLPLQVNIAVGMRITAHPPHRSERAQFRHSAPTLGE